MQTPRAPTTVAALLLAAIVLLSSPARAHAGERPWQDVATLRLSPGADRVVVPFGSQARERTLRIRIDGGSVFIRSVRISREGAPATETPLRLVLGPGEAMDLPAGATPIREVSVFVTPVSSETISVTVLAPPGSGAPVTGPGTGSAPRGSQPGNGLPPGLRVIAVGTIDQAAAGPAIPIGRDKGRLDWIGLQIAEGHASLAEIRMTLTGGEVLRFGVARPVSAGDVVALALPGETGHSVANVSVLATPGVPARGRAVVQVLARYASGWTGETGENRQLSAGWVLAGVVRPASRRGEPQVIAVGEELGRYRRIRLVARNGDIDLREVVIGGSGGGRDARSLNQPLFRDQPLAPIDLEGARQIDTVTISARARSAHATATALEVWLQH